MKLDFRNNLFCFECDIVDNALPRKVGFGWDNKEKIWKTPFASIASKVSKLGTPEIAEKIKEKLEFENKTLKLSSSKNTNLKVPSPEGKLFKPFQLAGIDFMRRRLNNFLTDEMGLGKTIQAIGLCNLLFSNTQNINILIVCPANLRRNWVKEWETWSTLKLSVEIANTKVLPKCNVVITNYEKLSKQYDSIHSKEWNLIILDESHYLKSNKTQRTFNVYGGRRITKNKEITKYVTQKPIQADRKLAMTGTPILNRPIELFTTLKYLDPFAWPNRFDYAKRYCNAKHTRFGFDESGASNLAELQSKLRSSIMIRRIKADVLKDIPKKIRQIIEIDADKRALNLLKEEKNIFKSITNSDMLNEESFRKVMTGMSKALHSFFSSSGIRKEIGMVKLPYVKNILENAIESSEKVICFCWHRDVALNLKEHFKNEAVIYIGGMTDKQKEHAENSFQTEINSRLFIGNIEAAGIGLTLTAASHVIFAEEDWVALRITQAEDRVHRIGQEKSVLIQHVVLKNSLDTKMAYEMIKKQEIAEKAINIWNKETEKELEELLK